MSVARLKKNFYIWSVFQEYLYDITYCESVFRKSFSDKRKSAPHFLCIQATLELCGTTSIFMMCRETMYVAPEAEIYEILAEGVLCNSPMEGVGEEDGNGGFA